MNPLALHDFHHLLGSRFLEVNGLEVVDHYGDIVAEHTALRQTVGLLDLGFRGRLCLLGADRKSFLNGQVTNNVKDLAVGRGCYAALVTAKGKMESDLNIYCLENELLLDFEPGLTAAVQARLEKFIIAEDVQTADVAPHYGLLSLQGPGAAAVLQTLSLPVPSPALAVHALPHAEWGEIYVTNQPRLGGAGFDLFFPAAALPAAAETLLTDVRASGGLACGWSALEIARIEAGLPRFGADMDNSTLPPEAGLDSRAVSYSKGCYIGQEVIARIRTYGQVARALRGLRLPDELAALPKKGDKLLHDGKEVGFITSAAVSPTLKANIALGYVRKEANAPGTRLQLQTPTAPRPVLIVPLPFVATGP